MAVRKISGVLTLLFLLIPGLLFSVNADGLAMDGLVIDWPNAIIQLDLSLDMKTAGIRLPSGRLEAERKMDNAAAAYIMPLVLDIMLDSHRSISTALQDGSIESRELNVFLENWKRSNPVFSSDGSRLLARYQWKIAELSRLFVRHSSPMKQREALSYTPTRAYSGIVIFVNDLLPVRGEKAEAGLVPCLFPKIYDEKMEIILERNLLDPGVIGSWGSLAYAYSLDDPVVEERAGNDPLRIFPFQIFGTNRTDVVISEKDAMRILASPENRELLKEGRVVFIIPAPGK